MGKREWWDGLDIWGRSKGENILMYPEENATCVAGTLNAPCQALRSFPRLRVAHAGVLRMSTSRRVT